jgi:hypothetical protein
VNEIRHRMKQRRPCSFCNTMHAAVTCLHSHPAARAGSRPASTSRTKVAVEIASASVATAVGVHHAHLPQAGMVAGTTKQAAAGAALRHTPAGRRIGGGSQARYQLAGALRPAQQRGLEVDEPMRRRCARSPTSTAARTRRRGRARTTAREGSRGSAAASRQRSELLRAGQAPGVDSSGEMACRTPRRNASG